MKRKEVTKTPPEKNEAILLGQPRFYFYPGSLFQDHNFVVDNGPVCLPDVYVIDPRWQRIQVQ
jgi:hypothetical protein